MRTRRAPHRRPEAGCSSPAPRAWRAARAFLLAVLAVAVLLAGGPSRTALAEDPPPAPDAPAPPAQEREIEVFVRDGCPHCEKAVAFLERLARERPDLRVRVHHLGKDREAVRRLKEIADRTGTRTVAAPAIHVRDRLVVGWSGEETTGRVVLDLLAGGVAEAAEGEPESCPIDPEPEAPPCETDAEDLVDVPFLGSIRARDLGLPLFTVVIGLVDGFNPCAMWVLLFLLTILVNLKDRAKMLAIAGTFVVVSGLVYFAFMAAWLNFFLLVGIVRWVQVVLGVLALFVGLVHVKDFFAFHKGLTLSIPESVKPALYERVRRILTAQNLTGAMAGVIALAFMVNTIELLCTAGLPAVYTRVLTQQGLSRGAYYGYLALYQVFYMLDDALMLLIAVVTLSRRRLQERGGRWLKLVSGLVIAVLGLLLIVRPEWLYW